MPDKLLDPIVTGTALAVVGAFFLLLYLLGRKPSPPKPQKPQTVYIHCYAAAHPRIRQIVVARESEVFLCQRLELVTFDKVEERVKFWKGVYDIR